METPTISVNDVLAIMQEHSDEGRGDMPVYISIPFRNGIGMHYEGIDNISTHGEIVDIFTTTPTCDDVKKPKH